jgi:hypothetical protein
VIKACAKNVQGPGFNPQHQKATQVHNILHMSNTLFLPSTFSKTPYDP